jgi:hypothetical protein
MGRFRWVKMFIREDLIIHKKGWQMTEYRGQYDQKHVDKANGRNLRLVAPEQSVSAQQVADLQDALIVAQNTNPNQLRDFTIYSEIERRRLTVNLGVVGVHAQLHHAANTYSALMTSAGILPRHGRHEWSIGH